MSGEKVGYGKKNITLVISILLFVLLIVGSTFAYLIFSVYVTNGVYNTSLTCFNVTYDINNSDGSSDITGTLFPSSGPSGGLNGAVKIGIDPDCNVNAIGNLYLDVDSASDLLFQTVEAHCENSQTLKTMTDYTTEDECVAATNGTWVTDGGPLKYAVYNTSQVTSSTVPIKVGYLKQLSQINIYEDFILYDVDSETQSSAATAAGFGSDGNISYYIYIWMDGNLTDNSYASLSLVSSLDATVVQADCDLTDSDCYTKHTSDE